MTDMMIGKTIPSTTLDSSNGGKVDLPKDIFGKWTILYFYPKDDTPGCAKEACAFRDSSPELKKRDINVYGVSMDDLKSHASFTQKYRLNFPLLSDAKHELSASLGVYGGQNGLSRDTFLVDPKGTIQEVWRKVNPETTAQEALNSLQKYF